MQIALLDFPAGHAAARRLSFSAPQELDGIDLLVWHPDAQRTLYRRASDGTLAVGDSQRLVQHTRAWRDALRAFLARGGTLVVVTPEPSPLRLHTVQDIVAHDLLDAVPMAEGLQRAPCAPQPVACGFGEPFRSFFATFGAHFRASTSLQLPDAQPAATAAVTGQPCALYRYRHPGRLLLLPGLAAPSTGGQEAPHGILLQGIVDMVGRLRREARTPFTYPWPEQPPLPGEAALRALYDSTVQERQRLQARETELAARLQQLDFLRLLLCGDAVGVVDAAAHVLHALGAYVQKGLHDMNMVMFEHAGRVGVLVLVDDADCALGDGLPDHVRQQADGWRHELNSPVRAIALYIGGHRRGVHATQAERAALRARHASLPWWCGSDLLQAYEARAGEDWLRTALATPGPVGAAAP